MKYYCVFDKNTNQMIAESTQCLYFHFHTLPFVTRLLFKRTKKEAFEDKDFCKYWSQDSNLNLEVYEILNPDDPNALWKFNFHPVLFARKYY